MNNYNYSSNSAENLRNLVKKLDSQERFLLLRELLAVEVSPYDRKTPAPDALEKAETWLWNMVFKARPSGRDSRLRTALIFMFLRYGGLRLKEIFGLQNGYLNFADGQINLPVGMGNRIIPLALEVNRKIRSAWLNWPVTFTASKPLLCDSSLVRKGLSQCARACGMDDGTFTSRSLRNFRSLELAAAGVHPDLVNLFMGRVCRNPYFEKNGFSILRKLIQAEPGSRTSARNSFHGRISDLLPKGILVDIKILTDEGVNLRVVITEASRARLGLAAGSAVRAIVKAPLVKVWPAGSAVPEMENALDGRVTAINEDENACEIIVTLAPGTQLCALSVNGAKPEMQLQCGMDVQLRFSAYSVILTVP